MKDKEIINEIKQDFKMQEEKHKQIKEMAKEMSKELCCYYDKKKRKCSNCFGMEEDCDLHCNFGRTLERLSNAGYQKVDKDSIVLSREEHETLVKTALGKIGDMKTNEFIKACLLSGWAIQTVSTEEQVRQASKETAKKIFSDLHRLIYSDKTTPIWIKQQLNELAKQFGVEIKEN